MILIHFLITSCTFSCLLYFLRNMISWAVIGRLRPINLQEYVSIMVVKKLFRPKRIFLFLSHWCQLNFTCIKLNCAIIPIFYCRVLVTITAVLSIVPIDLLEFLLCCLFYLVVWQCNSWCQIYTLHIVLLILLMSFCMEHKTTYVAITNNDDFVTGLILLGF